MITVKKNKINDKFSVKINLIPKSMKSLFYTAVAIATAMIGYHIHHSRFWAVMDFFFWPFAWIKWLILQQVDMSIIRETFAFFFK